MHLRCHLLSKAVLVGIDGAQLEQYERFWARGKAQTIVNLNVAEAYTDGFLGILSEQPTKSGLGWATVLTEIWIDQHATFKNKLHPISFKVKSLFQYANVYVSAATLA